jgi:hypothetical protein
LERVVERLCDEGVVPLLGAGVSNEAKSAAHPNFIPKASAMKEKLGRFLWRHAPDGYARAAVAARLGISKTMPWTEKDFEKKLEAVDLAKLAQVAVWAAGENGHWLVCGALEIGHFATLEPRPAHRYIAYLAREGLIGEVITTNYDTCLEKAFQNSFGPNRWDRFSEAALPLVVIRDLQEHRRSGALRRTRCALRRPVLRLYKINGDADAYNKRREHTDRIALTEQQLQSFRDNHWARDLFQDRVRSHTFLFSGFGSDEPQIRHTALSLIDEFSREGDNVSPEETRDGLFIQGHGVHLTFNQYQVLRGYLDRFRPGDDPEATNTFTGRDAADFRIQGDTRWYERDKLTADAFWRGIYVAAVRKLLERYSRPRYPFYQWLHGIAGDGAGGYVMRLRRLLYPDDSNSPESLFGAWPALFCLQRKPLPKGWPYRDGEGGFSPAPLLLWSWLWSMRTSRVPVAPGSESGTGGGAASSWDRRTDWYLPLREDSLLILATLLALALILGDDGAGDAAADRVKAVDGLGLEVQVGHNPDSPSDPGPLVCLVNAGAAAPPALEPEPESRTGRLLIQLAVPHAGLAGGGPNGAETGRWIVRRGSAAGVDHVVVGRYLRAPVSTLISTGPPTRVTKDNLRLRLARLRPESRSKLRRLA